LWDDCCVKELILAIHGTPGSSLKAMMRMLECGNILKGKFENWH